MKVIVTKEDKMSEVLGSISSVVSDKFYYIPGWFERDDNGDFQFHHMNNLPEELKQAVEELQQPSKKEKE